MCLYIRLSYVLVFVAEKEKRSSRSVEIEQEREVAATAAAAVYQQQNRMQANWTGRASKRNQPIYAVRVVEGAEMLR